MPCNIIVDMLTFYSENAIIIMHYLPKETFFLWNISNKAGTFF